ncbi:hypothetical protein AGDE_01230 [Angomonas deanei]|uniref:DUF423 domain-containing protein n=1 Tax=Angomonas deanei TaxID=59799 RepID=S9VP69_9TRYP|nr:hypothetical protein AGDE_02434 [Angomonas deanei]EPY42693.1 hypothetical protein AGDE_01230 [Angomonas deanei]CAD2214092.1 Protein of unknown function (DUF423), putative [Angomonas deanei]|eukprot:EPY41490.1 hypothetical protein AGDE_02434 [Angomonas deanei]
MAFLNPVVPYLLTGVYGCTAIVMGTISWHGLKDKDEHQRASANIGAHYQLLHSAAMVGLLGLMQSSSLSPCQLCLAEVSFSLLAAGTTLFCGTVYAKVFKGDAFPKRAGVLAPTGGFLLMGGWLLIAGIPFLRSSA